VEVHGTSNVGAWGNIWYLNRGGGTNVV
jgi:hypothetical protein